MVFGRFRWIFPGARKLKFKLLDLLMAIATLLCIETALAFPVKPITLIVSGPPGGTADAMMRLITEPFAKNLGQPVILDFKPGASGIVASEFVSRAPADGHTLLFIYTSHAINPWLQDKLPYDSVRGFAPVAALGEMPLLLAVPASGHTNLAELITEARTHPGKLSYAAPTPNSASHLASEMFSQMTGGKFLMVPYKGTAPAAVDLAAGRVSMMLDTHLGLLPLVQANKVRIIGIASERPSQVFPNLEPIGRQLPGFRFSAWFGVLAPAGTPADVLARLNDAFNRSLNDPAIRERLIARGFEPRPDTAAGWEKFLAQESSRWGEFIRKTRIGSKEVR